MGKVDENKKHKREALLNTAYELFTTKGTNATAISDIVRQAGVAKGTFYLYFKDKYDIRNKLASHKTSDLFYDAYQAVRQNQIEGFSAQLHFMIDHILDALQEAHSAQKGAAGYLRLGFLDWNANPYIKVLENFMEQNPRILVDVLFQQFSELKKNFIEGRTDMIFTVSYDVEDLPHTEYHVEALEKIPLIAYMNRKNHLAASTRIRVEDLRPESMLMLDPNSCRGYSKYINGLFSSHHVSPLVYQYANSGREHLGNILLNRGILLASRNFLADTYPEEVAAVEVSDAVLYLTATWKKEKAMETTW